MTETTPDSLTYPSQLVLNALSLLGALLEISAVTLTLYALSRHAQNPLPHYVWPTAISLLVTGILLGIKANRSFVYYHHYVHAGVIANVSAHGGRMSDPVCIVLFRGLTRSGCEVYNKAVLPASMYRHMRVGDHYTRS